MGGTSELDVGYVARLARINLTEEEANAFQKQLDDVLKYVEKLRQADVSRVEPAAHGGVHVCDTGTRDPVLTDRPHSSRGAEGPAR